MEISRSNFLQVTFVLTEDYLTKIHRSFVEFANKEDAVSLEIECNDNLNRKFSGIKELLDFENTPSSQIKSLSIKAFVNENDNYRNADLTLYDDKLSNMYINIDGQKEDVLKLNGSIEAYLQGMKPWYSRVTNLDFLKVFPLLFLLSMIVIMCAVWFGTYFRNLLNSRDFI